MSLLDAFNEPCTRRETSDYGVDMPIMDGPYGDAAAHAAGPDPSERDQFHAAIAGHAAGTCPVCDTVRASDVFTRNGRRPMVAGQFRPARKRSRGCRGRDCGESPCICAQED